MYSHFQVLKSNSTTEFETKRKFLHLRRHINKMKFESKSNLYGLFSITYALVFLLSCCCEFVFVDSFIVGNIHMAWRVHLRPFGTDFISSLAQCGFVGNCVWVCVHEPYYKVCLYLSTIYRTKVQKNGVVVLN